MDIWITDLSERNCYTRFGKVIPKIETKIDMIKYFGRDVLEDLKADPLIKVIVHNAKDLAKEIKEANQKEAEANAVKLNEVKRKEKIKKEKKKELENGLL